MNAEPRSSRLLWIAGIVLLIGTGVGATLALNNGAHGDAPATNNGAVRREAVCIGYVDNEHGISNLYPTQFGRIVELSKEGEHYKKGDLLLKIDDRQARLRRDQAESVYENAKSLPKQHRLKKEQQEQAILEAEHHQKALEYKISSKRNELKLYEKTTAKSQYEDELRAAEEEAKRIDCKIQAEILKLRELNLANPSLDLKRAKAVFDEANLGVEECVLRAPADGILLRSLVHAGEVLGPNPKTPALQFAADGTKIIRAEILQEWASRFKKDQAVEIEDDTYAGAKWTGKIKSISTWYSHKRSIIFEPFTLNDARSLECLIDVNDADGSLRIGQRVRVSLVQK